MAHLQYMPGDPRLVDQLVYELKSKGIFDQFRKDCIADVDTRPAYQNLRQRVENSVTTFLSMQTWQPDMNKNQLREKLRKHILDGNYLEQGVERIVDQVVNPKVATVFIPKVEDLVYKVLGITRKKSPSAETSNEKVEHLLPNDLEAVSPGSVKSDAEKNQSMNVDGTQDDKMDIDDEKSKSEEKQDSNIFESEKENTRDIQLPNNRQNDQADKSNIPLPPEEIKPENIPSPDASPPKTELEKIELPKELIISTDIPLPNDICKEDKDQYFKPVNSEDDDDSSSGSSLRRNMSPLTPIRNFNNENSCDAQQAFENESSDNKCEDKKEPSSFRFKIDAKSTENSSDAVKPEKKEAETLSYQFNSQVNINNYNTPLYEDSSNSNNLHIDYESDVNSKVNIEIKVPENDHNSEDSRKEKKTEEKKSSHKSSHRSRDTHKHSGSKDKRSDSKHTSSRDSSRHDKSKSSKDDKSKSSDKEKSKDKSEKKDSSRESSRHRSSHKSSHKDSKSHRSSSSSGRRSSKYSDEKKLSSSSSSNRDKDKSSSEKSKVSKSSSHKSDKERKSSSSTKNDKSSSKSKDEKEKDKKSKKENDDHYGLSGRGNPNRRSTDRDSNDGSSSSKGSHIPTSSKTANSKKDSKSSSKSETTTTSGESTSPSDKENRVQEQHSSKTREALQHKPIVRIERRLEVASPPRLPFVPDVTIRKPKFAANLEEAKRLMKMRKFLDEEQKRMNQEAALLLEFQANVRPSMSQVYSNIPGPELEFACVSNVGHSHDMVVQSNDNINHALAEGHDEVNILNLERENINVSPEEDIVIPEHDEHVLAIGEARYTNNELLTVSNYIKDDEANEVMGYDVAIDNINETDPMSVDIVIESDKITDQQIEINTETSDKISENIGNNSVKSIDDISYISVSEEPQGIVKNIEKEVINESNTAFVLMDTTEMDIENNEILTKEIEQPKKDYNKKHSSLLQVTVITEELSEREETPNNVIAETPETVNCDINDTITENTKMDETIEVQNKEESHINGEYKLHYFGEREKYNAELKRAQFNNFIKEYSKITALHNKLYLVNCDSYEEKIIREVSKDLGDYEIISYHRNGHLTLPKNKNVIKNVNISKEISLPTDYGGAYFGENEPANNVFSPEKSDCSFELSTDYDSKLQDMVNKTSRREIMEIILGNVVDTSPSKMPQIDYVTESKIDGDYENNLKRKISDETTANVNNNRPVLTPNKIRKLSSDQISSTTHENEETPINKTLITRSKYLGKARRVGLPRPKRTTLPSSPSSDKSVENYEENALAKPATPNGKVTRSKVQRYDTSDLYKPKLHYLSRRNHVT